MAQLMVGGVDLIHVDSKDEPEMLAANSELRVAAIAGYGLQFLAIDAAGRSGNPPLVKLAVRQAIAMALDRPALSRSVMPGAEAIRPVDALCTPDQLGCDVSTKPPGYDPEGAKRLLAEAGYPDGFDIELSARPGTWTLGEAMAGELRKVGIRASVDKLPTMAAMRKKQGDGKLGLLIGYWPPLFYSDASSLVTYLFDDTPRSYWHDATIGDLAAKGLATEDLAQRKAIYRKLFDRVNEQSYVVPLAVVPDVFVHHRDLAIDVDPVHGQGLMLDDLRWN
jgi:peptide/nickel transport system substrate-binding protein